MRYAGDETWRVWSDLRRKEEELRIRSGQPFDSMGRHASAYAYADYGWAHMQMGRVERVRQALEESGPIAKRLFASRLKDLDLMEVWSIFLSAAKDIALLYGGSVIAGGFIGGVGGAFFGGVGAIPGAAAGATAGGYVGSWVLTLLGLSSFLDGMNLVASEAFQQYEKGFSEAWGPTHYDEMHGSAVGGNPSSAALHLANGHVVLVSAILTVIVAYLMRSKDDKTAFLNQISGSKRLGPKPARWIEQNQQRLQNHPALQSRGNGNAGSSTSPSGREASPPKRPERPKEEAEHSTPRVMPLKTVPCFKTNDLPASKVGEFDRQLSGQEAGINDMTVNEYLEGRNAFDMRETKRNANVALKARGNYEAKLQMQLYRQFRTMGLSANEADTKAIELASEKMATLAALHNPDMVAAGKDVIAGFGDRNVNSRIGAQWRQGERLVQLDRAAKAVPASMREGKMNAKLERCK